MVAVEGLGGLAHLIAPKFTLTPGHLPYGAGSGEGARRAGEVVQLRLRVIHPIGLEPSAPLFNAFDVLGGDCLAHCPVPPSVKRGYAQRWSPYRRQTSMGHVTYTLLTHVADLSHHLLPRSSSHL